MANCLHFSAKKAVIIHQADYSLTRLVCADISQLPATKIDAVIAAHIARGLGIKDKDITYIEDMTSKEINKIMHKIKEEFKELSEKGMRTLLYVYCAGRGVMC